MKKRVNKAITKNNKIEAKKAWDIVLIVVFFVASYISLNAFGDNIYLHILGIIYMIAGSYGIVSLFKVNGFIFNRINK